MIIVGFVLDFTQIEISHQEVTSSFTWICLDLPQICQGFEIFLDLWGFARIYLDLSSH